MRNGRKFRRGEVALLCDRFQQLHLTIWRASVKADVPSNCGYVKVALFVFCLRPRLASTRPLLKSMQVVRILPSIIRNSRRHVSHDSGFSCVVLCRVAENVATRLPDVAVFVPSKKKKKKMRLHLAFATVRSYFAYTPSSSEC